MISFGVYFDVLACVCVCVRERGCFGRVGEVEMCVGVLILSLYLQKGCVYHRICKKGVSVTSYVEGDVRLIVNVEGMVRTIVGDAHLVWWSSAV